MPRRIGEGSLHLGQLAPETGPCRHSTNRWEPVSSLSAERVGRCRPAAEPVVPAIARFTRASYTAALAARPSRFGLRACRDFTSIPSAIASRVLVLSSANGERRTDTIRSPGRARPRVRPVVPSCDPRTCGAEAQPLRNADRSHRSTRSAIRRDRIRSDAMPGVAGRGNVDRSAWVAA